ncbi:MAG: PP2C family protein-serine/threonine phosphatase [Saprospiraceae bacterium]|nr:PP2C family protein-serine/threonine phosphatase [Saprospiraceae bacterium]
MKETTDTSPQTVFKRVKQGLNTIGQLERDLNLKQLQINRLLNITQAINNNVKMSGLFEMYCSFLGWEMGVKKMALFYRKNEKWECTAHIGVEEKYLKMDIASQFSKYSRLQNLTDSEHPFVKLFDVVIPVKHKDNHLAYVFIGGFSEEEDMYNKVQFITTITNIITVAIENKRLFKQQLEQERLKREMELASEMQQLLIPKSLPTRKDYELSAIYRPHMTVGGDYFDFVEHNDGNITFCIADIAGKGVAAALLMSNFQANFHTLLGRHHDLIAFVKELNEGVLRITKGERFITFFVAQYDKVSRTLTYVNAGHNPPAVAMRDQIFRLKEGCTVLGAFDELPFIEQGSIQLNDEALILLFTDGLTELQNEKGEFVDQDFGHHFVLNNYRLPAAEFNRKLMDELDIFKGQAKFQDDFTVLTCKIF